MNILIGYILTYLYLILVLKTISFFKKKYTLKDETSRKLIHILVGLSWFIMVAFFKTTIHLIIPPLTFIIINYLSYKKGLISSMERRTNNSKGTIYFAISYTILALITYFKNDFLPFYGIGALTMTFGDGLAPFIGNKYPQTKIKDSSKTYAGSLIIMLTSLIIAFLFNSYYHLNYTIFSYLIITLVSPILEFIGLKGTDNLTLPLGLALISSIL